MLARILLCYLIGSIPTGYILSKTIYNIDLRFCGSGSTGATNVLRCTKSKSIGAITLFGDLAKGAVIAYLFKCNPYCFLFCFAGLLGHCYPCWLNFHGGRGVSMSAGMFFAINPLCATIAVIAWALSLVFIKISAVASLSMSFVFLASVLIQFFLGITNSKTLVFALCVFLFLVWTHRIHIQNWISGSHNKT